MRLRSVWPLSAPYALLAQRKQAAQNPAQAPCLRHHVPTDHDRFPPSPRQCQLAAIAFAKHATPHACRTDNWRHRHCYTAAWALPPHATDIRNTARWSDPERSSWQAGVGSAGCRLPPAPPSHVAAGACVPTMHARDRFHAMRMRLSTSAASKALPMPQNGSNNTSPGRLKWRTDGGICLTHLQSRPFNGSAVRRWSCSAQAESSSGVGVHNRADRAHPTTGPTGLLHAIGRPALHANAVLLDIAPGAIAAIRIVQARQLAKDYLRDATVARPIDGLRHRIGHAYTTTLHDADQPHRQACCTE